MSDLALHYDQEFFAILQKGSRSSAGAIVPVVMELVRPASVVDVGCGTGEFLEVFRDFGVDEILGIDGEYLDRSSLAIPQERFMALDLRSSFTLDRTYDLAVCLEVGEHLPPTCASGFIESLTRLAPVILFSAAIPHQGGMDHVNEQWPDYWVQLFRARDFVPADAIRKKIWSNSQVEVWYRQNILLFCNKQALASNGLLAEEFRMTDPNTISKVHPEFYLDRWDYFKNRMTVVDCLRMFAGRNKVMKDIYHRLRR